MFSCLKNLEFKKIDVILLTSAILLGAIGLLLWWCYPVPLSMGREVSYPYYTTLDEQGNTYLINEGKSEILKINEEQQVIARLSYQDHEEDVFQEANGVAVDSQGNIYIHDVHWMDSGLGMAAERIIKFDDKGNYVDVVWEEEYNDVMIMKRHFFSLVYQQGEIRFAVVDGQEGSIVIYGVPEGEHEPVVRKKVFRENVESIQDIAIASAEKFYFVDKFGDIYCREKIEQRIYETPNQTFLLPYSLTVGETGEVYFSDLCNNEIYQIVNGEVEQLFTSQQLYQMTGADSTESLLALQVKGTKLCMAWGNSAGFIDLETGAYVGYSQMKYHPIFQVVIGIRYVLYIVSIVILLYYLLVLVKYLIVSKIIAKNQTTAVLMIVVACTTIVVMSSMLKHLREVYVEERLSNMCSVTQIAADNIDSKLLNHVTYPADYGNESYQKLQEFMGDLIDVTSEYSENMYCNLVKVQEGHCYALAYLDNSIGAYYPLDARESEEAKKVYETKERLINDGKSDSTGTYVYVKEPILDQNKEVVGIIEVGMVSDTLSAKIDEIRIKIIVSITLMVIIAIFLLKEAMSFWESHKEWERKKRTLQSYVFPISWFRILVVLCFAAYNMPSSFLPVYMEGFYDPSLPIQKELAGSLPLTLNFMMIGLMSLLCSKFMRKLGFKTVLLVGAIITFAGDFTMAIASNYWMATVGMVLNGIGSGFIMNSMSILVANQGPEDQEEGFAVMGGSILTGMISGTVIGAALAENIGESKMFFFSSAVWFLMMVFGLFTGGGFRMKKQEESHGKKGVLQFLCSRKVMGYFVLILIPYIVISGFTSYFLPVFADSYGLTESQTSLLLVMNCLVGIFLSGTLTKVLLKNLGRGAIYLAVILSLSSLILFSFFQNLYMLAFVLLLLGAAGSFGGPVGEILFCNQKEVQKFGEDRAMGYYKFAESIGESSGTMVFGSILTVGFGVGVWFLSGITVVLLLIYEWLVGKKVTVPKSEDTSC